jgi:hypothetical protein
MKKSRKQVKQVKKAVTASGASSVLDGKEVASHVTTRWVRVTPAMAEALLVHNTQNRTLKDNLVLFYARLMKEGLWHKNGDSIKVTAEGQILDGQHRLWAIFMGKTAQDLLFAEGVHASAMSTIDAGSKRTFGDVLQIKGHKNANVVASVIRWMYWHQQKGRPDSGATKLRVSSTQLEALLPKHDDVFARVSEVNTAKIRKILPPSIAAFVYVMAYRTDPAKAGAWLGALQTGIVDGQRHPVYVLRERMIENARSRAKLQAITVLAFAIKSWNALLLGRPMQVLRMMSDEDFPRFEKRLEEKESKAAS